MPPASAAAASPIDLGLGETSPRVVVDSTDRGYLTWEGRDESHLLEDETLYCRLDPGATSCSAFKGFGHPAGSEYAAGSAPLLEPSGNPLVLDDRFGTPNQTKTLYSGSEGFTTPHLLATTAGGGQIPDFTDALYLPPEPSRPRR